ncbi:MAG: YqaE/Pmp3 family membrane protein [Phycisphaerales bacterium]|nr:YqaE/Pmp3 family membrane protein [Phycisphaerales bacterium]
MSELDQNKLLLVIIAILLPPLAVGLKAGFGGTFVLNLILWILFYIPGLIHALIVILK